MRIHKNTIAILLVFILLPVAALFLPAKALAGPRGLIRLVDMDGGDSYSVNLTVEQVSVSPIRAYVGDAVYVDVVIDNRENGSDTSWVEIYANNKAVAKQMFRWGGPGAHRKSNVSVKWDTTGMAPGGYKIRAEVFVFDDLSPFDNELTLSELVILAAPGGQFPGGAPAGGSATEIDPRYK